MAKWVDFDPFFCGVGSFKSCVHVIYKIWWVGVDLVELQREYSILQRGMQAATDRYRWGRGEKEGPVYESGFQERAAAGEILLQAQE